MSYFRRGMGDDGPITSPTQVDPDLEPGTVIIDEVTGPRRVRCDEMPADSPAFHPGQPCGPPATSIYDSIAEWWDRLRGVQAQPQAPESPSALPTVLLLGAAGVGVYYLTRKK